MTKRKMKFFQAVRDGKLDMINALLGKEPELLQVVNDEQKNCLHIAIERGLFPMTFYFLEMGVNVKQKDSNGWSPMHLAAAKGYLNIFRTILEHGGDITDVTNDHYNSLQLAVIHGQMEIVNEILEKRLLPFPTPSPSTDNEFSLLQLAVKHGQINMINMLIDKGMDVNEVHPIHGSLLRMAIKENSISAVELLLQRGIHLEHLLKPIKSSTLPQPPTDPPPPPILTGDIPLTAPTANCDTTVVVKQHVIVEGMEVSPREMNQTHIESNGKDDHSLTENQQMKSIEEEIFSSDNEEIIALLSRHFPQFSPLWEKNKTNAKQRLVQTNRGGGRNLARSAPNAPISNSLDDSSPILQIGEYKAKGKASNASKYKSARLSTENIVSIGNRGSRSSLTLTNSVSSSNPLTLSSPDIPFTKRTPNKDNILKKPLISSYDPNYHKINITDTKSKNDEEEDNTPSLDREGNEKTNGDKEFDCKEKNSIDTQIDIQQEGKEWSSGLVVHLRSGSDFLLHDVPIDDIINSNNSPPSASSLSIPLEEQNEIKKAVKIITSEHIVAYPGAKKKIEEEGFMWSWISKAAGLVIDEQAKESLEHISRLLNTLFSDREATRSVDALLALSYIAFKYKAQSITSSIGVSENEMEIGAHYFQFACAAYGWKMLNPLMFDNKQSKVLLQGLKVGDPMNNEALCEHTGIAPEDIIAYKWTSSDYHPAHYIAIDHSTASIVIAIRGSFHIKDALVDLIASSVKFKSGYAHTGMLECAKRKLEAIKGDIENCFEKFPYYRLVIVGHSLGAGTASLLTLLLKDEYPDKMMHCYAYATPCVLSADLALSCSDLITSYALGNDCVPRLSYGSIHMLKLFTSSIMNQTDSTLKLFMLIRSGKLDLEKLRRALPVSMDDHLLPPGSIYYINKDSTIPDYHPPPWMLPSDVDKCYQMEKSNATFFYELIISSSMFSDHLPWNYHQAFEGILYRHRLLAHRKYEEDLSSISEARFLNSTISFESPTPTPSPLLKSPDSDIPLDNNKNESDMEDITVIKTPPTELKNSNNGEIVILEGYYPVNSESPEEIDVGTREISLTPNLKSSRFESMRESVISTFFGKKKN